MATTKTRERASRTSGQASEDQPQQATPDEPFAVVASEVAPIQFYRPQVRVTAPDGEVIETITCSHETWWHSTPEIAERCGRKLAAQRGLKVGAAK